MRLWYTAPAGERWTAALPLGNGRLGAMVFGNVECEHIQLNEDSLWYGGPRDRNNPDALAHLPRIRQLLAEGNISEAERLAVLTLSGIPESERHYEPLGDLLITFNGRQGEVTEYQRELCLDSAIARVTYKQDGITYTRETIVSTPDQVLALRLTADRPGSISCTVELHRGRYLDETRPLAGDSLIMRGRTGGEEGIRFRAAVRAIPNGGTLQALGETLIIEQADSLLLLLTAGTSFRHADPESACLADLQQAGEKLAGIARCAYSRSCRAFSARELHAGTGDRG